MPSGTTWGSSPRHEQGLLLRLWLVVGLSAGAEEGRPPPVPDLRVPLRRR